MTCQDWYQPHRLETFALENTCFQLPPNEHITPTRLFTNFAPPLDMSGLRIPELLDFFPSTRFSKVVRRSNTAPSEKQRHMVAFAAVMHGTFLKLTRIPHLDGTQITTFLSR